MKLPFGAKKTVSASGLVANMSEKPKKPLLDLHQLVEDFKTIDPQDPGLWPLAPRVVTLLCGFLLLIAAAWWFGWSNQLKELEEQKVQELRLREDWLSKKKPIR